MFIVICEYCCSRICLLLWIELPTQTVQANKTRLSHSLQQDLLELFHWVFVSVGGRITSNFKAPFSIS